MSYADEAKYIENRLKSQWGSTTDIAWSNIPYKPTPGENYISLEIHNGDAFQASIGDSYLQRSTGIISINVHTGRDIGEREGRSLADSAAAVFRRWSSNGITCRMPKITRLGDIGDWFIFNVSIPFYRDEQFS